jgi:hypothetical protein
MQKVLVCKTHAEVRVGGVDLGGWVVITVDTAGVLAHLMSFTSRGGVCACPAVYIICCSCDL